MSPRLKKTISISLRTLVCVVAMYLVMRSVRWSDKVTLADGRTEVTIVNWQEVKDDPRLNDPDEIKDVRVKLDAPPHEIRLGDLAKNKDGSPKFMIGLASAAKSCDKFRILLALMIFAPVPLVQSIRFTLMVRSQDISLSYWEGIKLSYAGNFLNFVALGSTGGDVFKAYYVSTHTDRKTEAVTIVFLDRAVGMVSLVVIAAAAMLLKLDDPKIRDLLPAIGLLMLGLLVFVLVAFSRRVRALIRIERVIARLPFSDQLKRIDAATYRMRHHKKLLLVAFLMTVLLQGLAIASFTVAGIGLGMNPDPSLYAGYFAYLATALLISAIPVSPQGLGTMDGALQIFLRGVYGSYSQILFLGFVMRLMQLVWSLPGFLVPITGAHRPSPEKIAQLQSLTRPSES